MACRLSFLDLQESLAVTGGETLSASAGVETISSEISRVKNWIGRLAVMPPDFPGRNGQLVIAVGENILVSG